MSAIFGICRFDGGDASSDMLVRQSKALANPGADSEDQWVNGPIGVGRRLMRIVREDVHDRQPVRSDTFSIVADVRLDNREDLAGELGIEPDRLSMVADSALVLAAWERWEEQCVEHLLGDFAFAVWDARRHRLALVRDHMGQRHLYYHLGDGFLAFATETKGLFCLPDVPRDLDERRVMARLAVLRSFTDVPGETIWNRINAVPGGTIVTLDSDGVIASRRYWKPRADPVLIGRDEAFYLEAYRAIVSEAVACRVRRALAPASVLMGGGFDTSIICAVASREAEKSGQPFIAISSVMPENYQGEIRHARKWVELCGRHMPNLRTIFVTGDRFDPLATMHGAFAAHNNRHSPAGSANAVLLSELAKAGARVVMDGYGGDYTVNPRNQNALVRMLRQGEFRRFIREFGLTRRRRGLGLGRALLRFVVRPLIPPRLAERQRRRRSGLPAFGPTMPINRAFFDQLGTPDRYQHRVFDPLADAMQRTLDGLQDSEAMGTSIAASNHGLEFTQPFHDKRVVELGLAIPERLHYHQGLPRGMARRAMGDILPPEYRDRRSGNDDLIPDFLAMAKRVEPQILEEIDQIEASGRYAAYFDFPRMRQMLTRRQTGDHASGHELDTRQAMLAFIAAKFIQWNRRDNA